MLIFFILGGENFIVLFVVVVHCNFVLNEFAFPLPSIGAQKALLRLHV